MFPKVNGIARAPEGVGNSSLGHDYEENSFGERLACRDRLVRWGTNRGCFGAGKSNARMHQPRVSQQRPIHPPPIFPPPHSRSCCLIITEPFGAPHTTSPPQTPPWLY